MDTPMPNRLSLLLVLLLSSSLLFAAGGAHGAPTQPVASHSAAEEGFESLEDESEEEGEEEDEFVEVECETALEEAEEGEITLAEADELCAELTSANKSKGKSGKGKRGSAPVAPEECVLRSAHAHAAVNGAGDKLKLTIGYTAYQPIDAKVEVREGSSRIATKSLRLGRSGVLRIVKDLGKAEAPKRVVVRLAVPDSPGFCGKYETEKVAVR
jgi:hypothetical protein